MSEARGNAIIINIRCYVITLYNNSLELTMHKTIFPLAVATVTLALPAHSDEQPANELEAVIVTAPLQEKASETATPVTVLEGDDLIMKMGHTIGETLEQEQGVTNRSFGPGVGKPVIRGQSGPRVRVLSNGIGTNDVSQLSPDHAVSIEPIMAERIEVLRGPATLLYGSGAIGGVVNVIDNRIPSFMPEKPVGGAFEQTYNSVSDETSTALKAEGGKGHVAYHLDGLYRNSNNLHIGGQAIDVKAAESLDPSLNVIQNSYGVIPNTNTHTVNGSAGISLVGDPGFAGIAVNRLENNYGIPPNGSGGPNVRIDLKQSRYDFKSELNNPFGFAESLRMRLGYSDYHHTEFDGGEPGTAFGNESYEGRMELTHKSFGPFRGAAGFQALASNFSATDFGGLKTIVPTSQIDSYGVFGVESLDYGPVTYQVGARMEESSVAPQAGTNYSPPNGAAISSSYNYTPISASASGLWKIDQSNSLYLAMTRSQRAPQVQELLSSGFHDATRSYEQGDPNLRMETTYNLDLGYKFKADWVQAEVDLFHNWANDYIFQQRTGQFVYQDDQGNAQPCGSRTDCSPVVQTGQANAIFKGFESKLIFPVMENRYGLVDFTLFGDYTRGQFTNGVNVPRMPPLRYGFQIDYAKREWSTYLRLTRAEPQNFPGANDTPTAGYILLNAGAQYEIEDFHDAKLLLFVKGNNLLNENIRNSTSYLRNFSPEPGRGAEIGVRMSY